MRTPKVKAIFDSLVAKWTFPASSPPEGNQRRPRQSIQLDESILGLGSNGLELKRSRARAAGHHMERGGPESYILSRTNL
jgi:hypothetical protein